MARVEFRVKVRVGVRVRIGFRVRVRVLTGYSQRENSGLPTAQGEALYCSIEPNIFFCVLQSEVNHSNISILRVPEKKK